jgi:2-hydroxychromene-2-carboxylate isomerase
MNEISFYFDVISPYAWLAFDRLPQALEGHSVVVHYRPVLFAGLLGHWGQKGPAEIAPKRAWTYRQVAWLAHQQGTVLQVPSPHPFNPLAMQRLALASAPPGGLPNRRVVDALFRHVWCRAGADPNQPEALAALTATLAPQRDPAGADVKAELRQHTEAALAAGVFGVPTMVWHGVGQDRAFFGQDALPMLAAALAGDAWFDGPTWDEANERPAGVVRKA